MAKKTPTPKTTGARKPASAKPKPARKPAAAETPTVKASAKPGAKPGAARTIDRETFEAAVRRAAYELAKTRSFRDGSAFDDWVQAEKSVRARLAAEGVTVPRGKATPPR